MSKSLTLLCLAFVWAACSSAADTPSPTPDVPAAPDGVEEVSADAAPDAAAPPADVPIVDAEIAGPDADADAPPSPDADVDAIADADAPGLDVTDVADVADVADAAEAVVEEVGPWRSALYPDAWTPAHEDEEGRFLHDFSYAGYRRAEEPLPAPAEVPGPVVDAVLAHGADPSGAIDAAEALQAAIDEVSAAGGGVVYLPPGLYRADASLTVKAPGVVLRGAGPAESQLYFTTWEGLSYKSHIAFGGTLAAGPELALAADADSRATVLELVDASTLAPGDDIAIGWVITPEFVARHGMNGIWQAFNDTWQPFFWRDVVAVDLEADPHRVTVDVPLRYPALVEDGASLRVQTGTLSGCGVESLGLANAVTWDEAWQQDQVHVLGFDGLEDSWIRDVQSFSPPIAPAEGHGVGAHLQSGGIIVRRSKRVTVADTVMAYAEHRGGGGNGYLFEVRQSSELLIRDCEGRAGRHNFIQNWGFGLTGVVWLRIVSDEGVVMWSQEYPELNMLGLSEFHHSLATANLIDSAWLGDGWGAVNRGLDSSGAGHTATETVLWNTRGAAQIKSRQYGWGYVIGTWPGINVGTSLATTDANGTEPEDWLEGVHAGEGLEPSSLYEDQLARRLAAME